MDEDDNCKIRLERVNNPCDAGAVYTFPDNFNSFSAGTDFRRQILTSIVDPLKESKLYNWP